MFLGDPPRTDATDAAFARDRAESGYVHNYTRLWAWRPGLWDSFQALRDELTGATSLTDRELAIVVGATVSQREDSYCSLAWAPRLIEHVGAGTAAELFGDAPSAELSEREAALAGWARQVVRDPNATTAEEVEALRRAGLDDREIFEATAWVAFRIAVATVNDALGAMPDRQIADAVPPEVRAVVGYGRPVAEEPSPA